MFIYLLSLYKLSISTMELKESKEHKSENFILPFDIPRDVAKNLTLQLNNKYIIKKNLEHNLKAEAFYFQLQDVDTKDLFFMKIFKQSPIRGNENQIYKLVDNKHDNIIKTFYMANINFYNISITTWHNVDLFSVASNEKLAEKLTEVTIKHIFKGVLDALLFLYKKNVLYIDIKPENILLDSSFNAILTDMDMCFIIPDEFKGFKSENRIGTKGYVDHSAITEKYYSEKTLSWGLGVVLYIMIEKHMPINNPDYEKAIIRQPKFKSSINFYKKFMYKAQYLTIKFNENITDLLRKLLNPEHNERMSVFEIAKHPWLNN
jgi:serine/threonine protein kinase